jgi:hypothetical protein
MPVVGAWHPVRVTEPLPRSRGTVLMQVLVAAVFLAVIGGSVGLALGLRERDQGTSGAGDGGRAVQQTQEQQAPPDQPTGQRSSSGGSSPPCEERIQRQAGRTDLVQVLYIQTKLSEVWICRDDSGALYYQGHRFGKNDRLFLTDVEQRGDGYVATNATGDGTTVYRVSRQQLVIDNLDGDPEVQPVVSAAG